MQLATESGKGFLFLALNLTCNKFFHARAQVYHGFYPWEHSVMLQRTLECPGHLAVLVALGGEDSDLAVLKYKIAVADPVAVALVRLADSQLCLADCARGVEQTSTPTSYNALDGFIHLRGYLVNGQFACQSECVFLAILVTCLNIADEIARIQFVVAVETYLLLGAVKFVGSGLFML